MNPSPPNISRSARCLAREVGSGVFAKGSDIGADLVGEMSEKTKEEEQRVFDLQQQLQELENRRLQRVKQGPGPRAGEWATGLRFPFFSQN